MIRFSTLPITGHNAIPLANLFIHQEEPAKHLALVLPGLGYNADMPLLYYPSRLLLERNCDVLQIRPDYQGRAFQTAAYEDRLEWMFADALAGLQAGLAQTAYQKLVLVGKSIGTLGMALLLSRDRDSGADPLLSRSVTVWITPLLHETVVVEAALGCAAPSFFMAGTADSTYDPATLAYIQKKTGAQAWLAEKANHSLELADDPLASLELLTQGMRALSTFLDQVCNGF